AADTKLAEANEKSPGKDPEAAVQIAKAKLTAAQAELAALQAVIAADDCKYGDTSHPDELKKLTIEAATRQAEAKKANAEYELLAYAGDKVKLDAAKAALKEADEKLARIEKGEAEYTSIRGA